jgi:N-acetylglucosaminyldiphosphoundecaprenol N-acetyl-beta-D-mannosaminyltransferase
MPIERREFLGVRFDLLSKDEALKRLAGATSHTPYSYVVTPNVDHLVRLHDSNETGRALRPLYEGADLCLCDSKILHLLGRLRGVDLPVVPGSELTEVMFERVIRAGDRIAVVGGDAELLAGLRSRYNQVEFVQHCPPMGLRTNRAARAAAASFVAQSGARFSFIAVGSPQQEMIAAEAKALAGAAGTALCIGASLEFLTGQQKRAPRIAQRIYLEWAYRLLSDPKRMWRRYLVEGPRIFLLTYRWDRPAHRQQAAE